jgi:hypothetical protein
VWRGLDAQAAKRDAHDPVAHEVPLAVSDYAVLERTGSVAGAVGLGGLSLVPAFVLRRVRPLRFGALGWIVGVGLPIVAILIAEVLTKLP